MESKRFWKMVPFWKGEQNSPTRGAELRTSKQLPKRSYFGSLFFLSERSMVEITTTVVISSIVKGNSSQRVRWGLRISILAWFIAVMCNSGNSRFQFNSDSATNPSFQFRFQFHRPWKSLEFRFQFQFRSRNCTSLVYCIIFTILTHFLRIPGT